MANQRLSESNGKTTYWLFAILAVGLILRLVNLALPDMAFDDGHYSLRAIGYLDYVAAVNRQSTPVTWFPEPVWWQYLSFHDAPPLGFVFQWLFFKIGGDNLWAARLPFVLAGMLSIYAIFLLGKLIHGPRLGLLAACLLAITNYAVWISRLGFLDGFIVLWIILSAYFFLKAKNNPKNYFWWGVIIGAGILSKFTFLFLIPVFLLILIFWRRADFKNRWLYFSILAALLLISPVIIYNVMMLETRGHPDAVLSTFIGETPEDFQGLTRSLDNDFNIFTHLTRIVSANSSYGFWLLLTLGLIITVYVTWKNRPLSEHHFLIWSGLALALVLLAMIGAKDRYGVVLLPFLTLLIGIGWLWISDRITGLRYALWGVALVFIAWEIIFTVQTQWFVSPPFNSRLAVAANRPIFAGYNNLEKYVEEFYQKFPGNPNIVTYLEAPQLAKYQEERILDISRRYPNRSLQDQLLVFDDRLRWFPAIWTFERRRLYDGEPIHSLTEFLGKLSTEGSAFYTNLGLKNTTVIIAADKILAGEYVIPTSETLREFTSQLEEPFEEIRDYNGEVIFKVFKLGLKR